MAEKKSLTLGITVNLENYENIRLEVSGDVETPEEAEELAGFLDTILSRLGRGDDATAERVDSYRRRVFSTKPAKMGGGTGTQMVLEEIQPEITAEPAEAPAPEPPVQPAEPAVIPAPASAPAEAPAAPKPAPVAEDCCEECGVEVPKTQKQMSRLFLNRTLCKACMDRMTHPH
ncbi:hypothetical protein [Methanofollis fontis]|uniref:Uncharacterized protein n=1 Tax=Methanofollis fontis TaxID=2052832 RepID=A0A483CWX5_9EURY|nr:hypothetical protein [Methanofollis fontis]TAJ44226.1 hypothetical protein CUJ86_09390 [Methanofollis fontis]